MSQRSGQVRGISKVWCIVNSSSIGVSSNLERARRELIDQGLRNPLINYRVLRSKGLEIIDERSPEIFQLLVVAGKQLDFLSDPSKDLETADFELTERALPAKWFNPRFAFEVFFLMRYEIKDGADDLELGQPDEARFGLDPSRHTDQHLQTPYSTKELQKRLLETNDTARVYIEEQGVNLLYLTLGELIWYEDDNSLNHHRAPLILIPVELSRKSVDSRFKVKYTEGGIGGNVSLREKLKSDFRMQLPELLHESADETELDVTDYFDKIVEMIRNQQRWELDPDSIQIGFFSFGKFMMYHDLDEAIWPDDRKPSDHPTISRLLGEGFEQTLRTTLEDLSREELDRYLAVDNNFHIMDADSSQAQAIMSVRDGKSLAIQGPPGTGKSQTIANIMAELAASGRSVLFVAEKMAALEVVKRRLDQVGLGDLCLELHSHKANKRTVLAELDRTYKLGTPQAKTIDLFELEPSRYILNEYSEAVNAPIGKTEFNPYQAYGESLRLVDVMAQVPLPIWSDASVAGWDQLEYRQKLQLIEDLERRFQQDGLPNNNIFRGSNITSVIPSTRDLIRRQVQHALETVSRLPAAVQKLVSLLGVNSPANLNELNSLVSLGKAVATLPQEPSAEKLLSEWSQISFALAEILDAGLAFSAIRNAHSDQIRETVWTYDLVQIEQTIRNNRGGFFQHFNRGLRSAKKSLSEILTNPTDDSDDHLDILKELIEAQKLRALVEQQDSVGKRFFERLWKGPDSDWESLKDIVQAVREIQGAIQQGRLPRMVVEGMPLSQAEHFRQANAELTSIHSDLRRSLEEIFELLDFVDEARHKFNHETISDLQSLLQSWQNNPDRVTSMAALNSARAKLKHEGLEEFFDAVANWEYAPQHTVNLFRRNWFDQLITSAIQQRPALKDFDGLTHQARLDKFREMDRLLLDRNKHIIASRHFESLSKTSSATGQVRILREEFAKKRRHKPIRKLLAETYGAVQAIKPIFMMSPMSVASYLEPGTIEFDAVIFDEASQIRPADAFGSILRANQVVVVGDNRQMPPTSFFDSVGESDDDEDTTVSDFDSILDLFTSKGIKDQMLRWHYRSRHESLIAVSNYEFYENKLLIPPSPQPRNLQLGLVLHYLPDTVYEPGTRRYNRMEAREVAEAVIRHARATPELTLGVAAFSQAQMQAVRDELEVLRRSNLDCESFFNLHPEEPFFVKNLENVQGDERDVIFISIGYGKTADGRVSMNFGPLNRDGGERRLNVLISRARLRCEVFTNLSSDDIDLDRTQSRGVSALKNYLKYARTGELGIDLPSGREAGSPFEEAVAQKLIERGYKVHYQVGTAGFFIDLAIIDPENPGKYLIGIECDGASYHQSASARDRDRLRQAILESKGWTILRIWSTDWFNNPERELNRAVDEIEAVRYRGSSRVSTNLGTEAKSGEIERVERVNSDAASASSDREYEVIPYKIYSIADSGTWSNIEEVPERTLRTVISNVLNVESPIHIEELERRVVQVLGFKRATKKVRDAVQGALYTLRPHVITTDDSFVMIPNGAYTVVRERSALPNESRKIDYIHISEIQQLTLQICESSVGIQRDELIREICRVFGFNRVSQQMQDRVAEIIDQMQDSGMLDTRAGGLWLSK